MPSRPDLADMALGCAACGHRHPLEELAWRCAACGGVLDLFGFSPLVPEASVLAGRAAVRETGGTIVTVSEDQIHAAHTGLARAGLYVEPTAAVCWAALKAGLIDIGPVPCYRPFAVAPLCGSGLKSKPPTA